MTDLEFEACLKKFCENDDVDFFDFIGCDGEPEVEFECDESDPDVWEKINKYEFIKHGTDRYSVLHSINKETFSEKVSELTGIKLDQEFVIDFLDRLIEDGYLTKSFISESFDTLTGADNFSISFNEDEDDVELEMSWEQDGTEKVEYDPF